MKIPQLFIRVGPNKFSPIQRPMSGKPLYFWDDSSQQILPNEGRLQPMNIGGFDYLVLGLPERHVKS